MSTAEITSTHPLTIENLINIKHPSNPVWSPDGKRIAFLWDRADIVNLYLVNADGSGAPVALTSFSDGKVGDVFWSKDGNTVYFSRRADLWQVAANGGGARAVWITSAAEVEFSLSLDANRLAFVRAGSAGEAQHGGDLIIRSMSDGAESKIAHDDESIFSLLWSPDGSQIAYIGGSKIIRHDESPSYSGEKLIYAVFEYAPGQLYVVPAAGGNPTVIDTKGEYNGLAWTDSAHLTYDRQSNAFKTRTIFVACASGGAPQAIHEDKEDKY
jgi:Tol biopolymer transport system component